MHGATPAGRPPLVLIVSHQEWFSRSLETILAPGGYTVQRAYTAPSALARARHGHPDAIAVDSALPDRDGLELCRELRRDPLIPPSTPIVVISAESPTRQRRLDALRAGAWDYLGPPFEAEELRLRIEAFVQAKLDADHARAEGLVDPATGLYNTRGLARRARELGAQAARQHAAFGCVVFAPAFGPGQGEAPADEALSALVEVIGAALKRAGRLSDAIGRLGPTEFAVVAAGTDARGATRLAERLAGALAGAAAAEVPPFALRAGYYAVADFHTAPVDAGEAILRATAALQAAQADPERGWLREFGNGGARPA
jgi:PleD family two-component response regulator